MPRVESIYAVDPLTYVSGTTPGEQKITAQTTFPTLVSHGFVIAPVDGSGKQMAPPRYLSIVVELTGSAADDATVNWSICIYHPRAATTNKWRESSWFQAGGKNIRSATVGNLYTPDCPRGATRGFVHVSSLPANVEVNIIVEPMN